MAGLQREHFALAYGVVFTMLAFCLAWSVSTLSAAQELESRTESSLSQSPQRITLHKIYTTGVPKSLDELRMMDRHQQELVRRVAQVTVGLQIGPTQGSGVIVSSDGYVLTAAHVAGRANQKVRVIMPDGRQLDATSLGVNKNLDAALIKIKTQIRNGQPVQWPFAELGENVSVVAGSWCLALGHPGGYQPGRAPVARFGRVLQTERSGITTDCKLIGGDSGGPLFDMNGRVIGIHSRIGGKVTKNVHVPVAAFRDDWGRLASGESWGSFLNVMGRPVIGVLGDPDTDDAIISDIIPSSPAERAGLRPGDLVTRFSGQPVTSFDELKKMVNQKHPGDEITLEIVRDGNRKTLTVILAAIAGTSHSSSHLDS